MTKLITLAVCCASLSLLTACVARESGPDHSTTTTYPGDPTEQVGDLCEPFGDNPFDTDSVDGLLWATCNLGACCGDITSGSLVDCTAFFRGEYEGQCGSLDVAVTSTSQAADCTADLADQTCGATPASCGDVLTCDDDGDSG